MIEEVILVEGKDDITAVKAAVDAEVICTGGFGYKKELVKTLKSINQKRGIIILTDPDHAGNQIRRDIERQIGPCKHAFLPQEKSLKKGDIGVENATKEDIRIALNKARPNKVERGEEFSKEELLALNLIGGSDSADRRKKLGDFLGIGKCNSKQFQNRLNNFGISREEFEDALERTGMINGR